MVREVLNSLKEHIIGQHPYYSNAFSDVIKSYNGIIHNGEPIFPADIYGDYFYLRAANQGSFIYDQRFSLSASTIGVGASMEVVLVSCVYKADSETLIHNLINTLRTYQPENLRLTRFITQSEYVVTQELQGVGEEALNSALKRLRPDFSIVSVGIMLSFPIKFIKSNCYEKPCSHC